jgi:hypothetical protein
LGSVLQLAKALHQMHLRSFKPRPCISLVLFSLLSLLFVLGTFTPHVDHIQMRVVPSELHTNIQSGVVCRCIKEEDGIYYWKPRPSTSIAVGQIFFSPEPHLLHFAFKKQKPAHSKIKKQARAKPPWQLHNLHEDDVKKHLP